MHCEDDILLGFIYLEKLEQSYIHMTYTYTYTYIYICIYLFMYLHILCIHVYLYTNMYILLHPCFWDFETTYRAQGTADHRGSVCGARETQES